MGIEALNIMFALLSFLVLVILAAVAFITRSLSMSGAVSGLLIAYVIILLQGVYWFLPLLCFFILAVLATKYKRKKKKKKKLLQKRRGARNIVGNAGIAMLMALIGNVYGFVGAVATAMADTGSSEIGVLSKTRPRMVTNFKKAKAGTNGAVSVLGTTVAVMGALIIGIVSMLLVPTYKIVVIALISGVAGHFIDSYVGALIENRKIIGNSTTNLIATFSGALIAIGLSYAL